MSTVQIPQFDLPLRMDTTTGSFAVVEQDTLEEITDCVQAIIRIPLGSRAELPTFGIPDQTFTMGNIDTAPIVAAVQKWEPRATYAASLLNENLAQFVSSVLLGVEGGA